ncbi:MAG TPA: helix-turn-helix transcriptional regulator [Chloroflexota bacterium]|nr:helix-turn-helix transcriptional regulator [Chloroflexota bacterium]
MITNERQYRITKTWLAKFEQGAAQAEQGAAGLDPRLVQAMRDQYEGQAEELRAQLREYEELRAGRIRRVAVHSFADLPNTLIYGRIAAGLTHKELARRLGVSEQQVQRYETRIYKGVGVERLQAIADILGMKTSGSVSLPRRTPSRGVTRTRREGDNPGHPTT